jgi:hypothetical protein
MPAIDASVNRIARVLFAVDGQTVGVQLNVLVKLFSPFSLSLSKAPRGKGYVVRQAHHE